MLNALDMTGTGWRTATAPLTSEHASTVLLHMRTPLVLVAHAALTAVAVAIAMMLRFDFALPETATEPVLAWLPVLVSLHLAGIMAMGAHRTPWRYTGILDLRDLVVATAGATLAFYIVVHQIAGDVTYPRSILLLTALLTVMLTGGVRLTWRLIVEHRRRRRSTRVLIFGAGSAGEMIVRDMRRNGYEPVGFVDDDPAKAGQRIHRVPVLGNRSDLSRIIATEMPDEVLVAMPSVGAAGLRRLVNSLEPFRLPITTLPPLQEILGGRVTVSQMRRLAIEDLLPRVPVALDVERARRLITGRRVLVTGAGGSIGSELCRQIAALEPECLVLYERYENNLYTVLKGLEARPFVVPALGDVTDTTRLNAVMSRHRPAVVFHAAAHKHVPLMELNPCEAVKNNVIGTRCVAEASLRHGVERFVLVSTDKAVNPTSLMGATKRVAELLVQAMPEGGPLWATVRFGNVLGSNGSVVPHWLDQIGRGGPVTVTHPEVKRYFMLIPEAVQLILQAASVSSPRDILVLEMGEQIRLIDMARTLIRLSGFVPDEEIPITFVGLRPGEKLYEELVGPDEHGQPSEADKVQRVCASSSVAARRLLSQVSRLGQLAVQGRTDAVVESLCRMIPTFTPGVELQAQASECASARVSPNMTYPPRELAYARQHILMR